MNDIMTLVYDKYNIKDLSFINLKDNPFHFKDFDINNATPDEVTGEDDQTGQLVVPKIQNAKVWKRVWFSHWSYLYV